MVNNPFRSKLPEHDPVVRLPSWRDHAACLGKPTELWFPDDGRNRAQEARRICAGCPVRRECLRHALNTPETHGIWGGICETQRRKQHLRTASFPRSEAH